MKVVVDTGVFSASLDPTRRLEFAAQIRHLTGKQLFLAAATIAELRFGAIVAGWGERRRSGLEQQMSATTLIPVTDALLTRIAELRASCRRQGHPIADNVHTSDLWIAASAIHIDAPLVSADKIFRDVPGLELLS